MLVNTLQYHDAVEFVRDSETDDPQLVARGTKPWQDNGKESRRTQQWDHGLDRTHLQVSQAQHWRTRTMETRSSTLAGNFIVAEGPAGGMAFETAQRRESDSSRGRHGRCVGAG